MNIFPQIQKGFSRWIDSVASTLYSLFKPLRSRREVMLIETDHDTFVLHLEFDPNHPVKKPPLPDHQLRITKGSIREAPPSDWATMLRGSRAKIILRPNRFLFRPLELPKRAIDFLDGIVRAHIDQLTPWTATEAVFGWPTPKDLANDRIELTIAATARKLVAPYVQAVAEFGAASVEVLTASDDAGAQPAPIKVFEQRAHGTIGVDRIRRVLVTTFVLAGLVAAASMGYSAVATDSLDAEHQELLRKVATRRAALRAGSEFATSAQRMLERRKQTTPSAVIVLEALSQVLPDHTYVTELHVEGDKLQVVGITRDAPALIALIEQSAHFTGATFFAPTTRSPGEPGERFHIEARIKPVFAVGA